MIRAVSEDLLKKLKAEASGSAVAKSDPKAKILKRPLVVLDAPQLSGTAPKAGKARVFAKLPSSRPSSR